MAPPNLKRRFIPRLPNPDELIGELRDALSGIREEIRGLRADMKQQGERSPRLRPVATAAGGYMLNGRHYGRDGRECCPRCDEPAPHVHVVTDEAPRCAERCEGYNLNLEWRRKHYNTCEAGG